MFVMESEGDNIKLKALHVLGKDEVDFTSTSMFLKSKQPIILVISFSLFKSVLNLPEFNGKQTLLKLFHYMLRAYTEQQYPG